MTGTERRHRVALVGAGLIAVLLAVGSFAVRSGPADATELPAAVAPLAVDRRAGCCAPGSGWVPAQGRLVDAFVIAAVEAARATVVADRLAETHLGLDLEDMRQRDAAATAAAADAARRAGETAASAAAGVPAQAGSGAGSGNAPVAVAARPAAAGTQPTAPPAVAPPPPVTTTPPPPPPPPTTAPPPPPPGSGEIAGLLFSLVNQERAAVGLPALGYDSGLASLARAQSGRIAAAGSLFHQDLSAVLGQGWSTGGENVAYGPSASWVHSILVNSWSHYANMTNPAFTHLGVGVVVTDDGQVWVAEVFGG